MYMCVRMYVQACGEGVGGTVLAVFAGHDPLCSSLSAGVFGRSESDGWNLGNVTAETDAVASPRPPPLSTGASSGLGSTAAATAAGIDFSTRCFFPQLAVYSIHTYMHT